MIIGAVAIGAATPAAPDPWRFVPPHPEVGLVMAAAATAYWYALTRLGPRMAPPGQRVATKRQVWCFAAGLLTVFVASSWPVHDWAEQYLYSMHMAEHMLITLIGPPLLLLGVPGWLTRWILRPRWAAGTVRVLARPLVAGFIFNAVIAIGHAPFYVNYTLYHHFWHFWAHLLLFTASMLMWFPVVNTLPEFPRMNRPIKMLYLFLQSVIPNVPVAFLAFASGVVYTYYSHVPRPFSIGVVSDQQLAGAVMKVGGTFLLWGVILVVFFRWSAEQERIDAMKRRASRLAAGSDLPTGPPATDRPFVPEPSADVLTWAEVEDELAHTRPAEPGN
jgi:putative membrane protein